MELFFFFGRTKRFGLAALASACKIEFAQCFPMVLRLAFCRIKSKLFLWRMLRESNLLTDDKHCQTMLNTLWPGQRNSGFTAPTFHHHCSTIFQTVPKAAVCFLVFPLRCVFAPLNPAFTVPEIEFEFQDLPCHTVVVMEGEDNTATLQVGVAKSQIRISFWNILDSGPPKGINKSYDSSYQTVSLYWSHSLNISRSQQNRRSKCWRCSCIPRPLDCLVFGFINKAQWIWSNAFQMLSSRVPEMTLHWCCTPLALRRNQRSWPGQL